MLTVVEYLIFLLVTPWLKGEMFLVWFSLKEKRPKQLLNLTRSLPNLHMKDNPSIRTRSRKKTVLSCSHVFPKVTGRRTAFSNRTHRDQEAVLPTNKMFSSKTSHFFSRRKENAYGKTQLMRSLEFEHAFSLTHGGVQRRPQWLTGMIQTIQFLTTTDKNNRKKNLTSNERSKTLRGGATGAGGASLTRTPMLKLTLFLIDTYLNLV